MFGTRSTYGATGLFRNAKTLRMDVVSLATNAYSAGCFVPRESPVRRSRQTQTASSRCADVRLILAHPRRSGTGRRLQLRLQDRLFRGRFGLDRPFAP